MVCRSLKVTIRRVLAHFPTFLPYPANHTQSRITLSSIESGTADSDSSPFTSSLPLFRPFSLLPYILPNESIAEKAKRLLARLLGALHALLRHHLHHHRPQNLPSQLTCTLVAETAIPRSLFGFDSSSTSSYSSATGQPSLRCAHPAARHCQARDDLPSTATTSCAPTSENQPTFLFSHLNAERGNHFTGITGMYVYIIFT